MCFGGGDAEIEETPLEREVARIAAAKHDYLRPQLLEAENFYIEKVQGLNDAEKYQELSDQVSVSSAKQFDTLSTDVAKSMAERDVDPTSGKFQGTLADVADTAGTVQSDNVNRAQTMQQDQALKGMGNLVAMGEGESAEALDGMMTLASNSSAYAGEKARQAVDKYSQRSGTLATAAGIGYEVANGNGDDG